MVGQNWCKGGAKQRFEPVVRGFSDGNFLDFPRTVPGTVPGTIRGRIKNDGENAGGQGLSLGPYAFSA